MPKSHTLSLPPSVSHGNYRDNISNSYDVFCFKCYLLRKDDLFYMKGSCSTRRLLPRLGRSPGEEKGYPLQYSHLENSMVCSLWAHKESDTTNDFTSYKNKQTHVLQVIYIHSKMIVKLEKKNFFGYSAVLQDLSFPTKDGTQAPAMKVLSHNH